MITLSEKEKKVIERLGDPLYTPEYIQEWVNRDDNVMINPAAAMSAIGAKGFYTAVKDIIERGITLI